MVRANGFIAKSIQQAIAAGDQDRAAQLIEENGCFLLMSGEVATLLNWTDAIEFQSEAHPWLAIQKAWALALYRRPGAESSQPCKLPEKLLSPLEPQIEVRTMQGTIAAARAQCANSRGDTHRLRNMLDKRCSYCPTAVPSLKAYEVWRLQSWGCQLDQRKSGGGQTRPTPKPSVSAERRITFTWSSSPTRMLPIF